MIIFTNTNVGASRSAESFFFKREEFCRFIIVSTWEFWSFIKFVLVPDWKQGERNRDVCACDADILPKSIRSNWRKIIIKIIDADYLKNSLKYAAVRVNNLIIVLVRKTFVIQFRESGLKLKFVFAVRSSTIWPAGLSNLLLVDFGGTRCFPNFSILLAFDQHFKILHKLKNMYSLQKFYGIIRDFFSREMKGTRIR